MFGEIVGNQFDVETGEDYQTEHQAMTNCTPILPKALCHLIGTAAPPASLSFC
jgi:hypothetical protein